MIEVSELESRLCGDHAEQWFCERQTVKSCPMCQPASLPDKFRHLLIEAEAFLCDVRAGKGANDLSDRIIKALNQHDYRILEQNET